MANPEWDNYSGNERTFSAADLAQAEARGFNQAREMAALECERHAAFCKRKADNCGDFKHLMARREEAMYNSQLIRALQPIPQEPQSPPNGEFISQREAADIADGVIDADGNASPAKEPKT